MNLNAKTITAENSRWIAGSQILVEGILGSPGELEPIETILEVSATSEITEARIAENKILLCVVAYFKVLYLDTEGGIFGF